MTQHADDRGDIPVSLVNLRDVATASPLLAPGLLFRSDAPLPGDLTDQSLVDWPPRTVIDLRGRTEKQHGHPYAGLSEIIELPILEGSVREHSGPPRSLGEIYRGMIGGRAAQLLAQAVGIIAGREGTVLVHCTGGKDRTGVTIALTLSLLGIDRDAIAADYALTTAAMPLLLARLPATAGTRYDEMPREFREAPIAAIHEVIDIFDAHPGGAAGWFLAHGGEAATIDALGRRLLT